MKLNRLAVIAAVTAAPFFLSTAAQAAECVPSDGTPAVEGTPAVTHIVKVVDVAAVEGSPAVTHEETVIDVQGSPAVPAVTHDVLVIDVAAKAAVPAITHTECRTQTRTKLYGSKEVKSVEGYDFVDGGTTTVDGHKVSGHWVVSAGTHAIPDVIINIVWGPSGVPAQYLGDGTVNLSVYGGPNKTVKYHAVKVTTDAGYTDFGPWSDWSATITESSELVNSECKTVMDVPAVDAVAAVTHVETVVDSPAIPAVLEVSHVVTVVDVPAVEAVAEVSHTEVVIDAPAVPGIPATSPVICPVVVPPVPPVVVPPKVTPPKHAKPPVLPQTGTSDLVEVLGLLGLALVAVGTTSVILGRRKPRA